MDELNAITDKYLEAGKQKAPSFKEIVDIVTNQNHLQENLINANTVEIELFKDQAKQDKELFTIINTPIGKLPKYRYLGLEGISKGLSLLNVINYTSTMSDVKSYFLKKDDTFVAFLAYAEDEMDPSIVVDVKLFDFDKGQSFSDVIFRDTLNLMSILFKDHKEVRWSASAGNKAIKVYDSYLNHKKNEGYVVSRNPPIGTQLIEGTPIHYTVKEGN
jgi:hypothetical protein